MSIVDYTRSPDTTNSAAIDPIFKVSPIKNEGNKTDYAFYWSSTSHTSMLSAEVGAYLSFGRALGFMSTSHSSNSRKTLMDVHGAGAQRSDPKSGDPAMFPTGRGPQGDVIRIYNLARCVRGGTVDICKEGPAIEMKNSLRRMHPSEISHEENGKHPPSGKDFVRRLDRNGDGKVSRREFDGPPNHFSDFDRNRDGYITSDEAPSGPPTGARHTR